MAFEVNMFANFYDSTKTDEANKKEFEKAKHNKEVTQHYVTAVAFVAGVVGMVFTVRKIYKSFE